MSQLEDNWENIDKIVELSRECESFEYRVTRNMVQKWLSDLGIENPWYTENSPFGTPIAPAVIGRNEASRSEYWEAFEGRPGLLHASSEFWFINPLKVGKKVRVEGKWVEKYQKRGRPFVAIEAVVIDEDGLEILRCKATTAL